MIDQITSGARYRNFRAGVIEWSELYYNGLTQRKKNPDYIMPI